METAEDLPISHQSIGMQSSPKPSTRFPALAQAGPIAQTTQPSRTISTTKPVQTQPHAQQWVQQVLQHPRGPQLGFFTPDRERPTLQPASTQPSIGLSDPLRRADMVAKEAEWERGNAMRLQLLQARELQAREQQAREQQAREQQAREQQAREQQAREQQAREQQARHQQQQQQQQQQHRQRLEEQQGRRQQQSLKSETDPQNMSQYEQYSTQGQQPNIVARSRIEGAPSMYVGESRLGPSIYAPRDTQAARDISSDMVSGGPSGLISNPVSQLPRTTTAAPHVHLEASVAPRAQPPVMAAVRQQETVRKTSSIRSLLNDDPPTDQRIFPIKRNSDGPPAPVQPSPSPAAQQPLYPPARSLSGGQPGQMRRKTSIGDMQSPVHNYPRSAAPTQGPMRVVESPFSTTPQSHQAQPRSQIGSSMDAQQVPERDGYPHQQQYGMQRQQQPPTNPQQYQPGQAAHRQIPYASSNKRTASPPSQYQTLQASRNNSFEFPPAQVHYGPGPPGPPTTMSFQSVSQPHPQMPSTLHYQSSYPPSPYESRESYRPAPSTHTAATEQQRHQLLLQQRDEEIYQQRRLDERRRYEDSRRQ
jgi:hypothetical protein